ncbi:hypothetical protein CEXT_626951 [Caerostris extrusa]|uniref:Uncharacterized protein n=1 Tax=Caerostris extrusa TaxID=172846 RepID=A0AAV4M6J7_CAEEX|nr:hypothetical protein CEXT_626951 [Caerostris extrusa]
MIYGLSRISFLSFFYFYGGGKLDTTQSATRHFNNCEDPSIHHHPEANLKKHYANVRGGRTEPRSSWPSVEIKSGSMHLNNPFRPALIHGGKREFSWSEWERGAQMACPRGSEEDFRLISFDF